MRAHVSVIPLLLAALACSDSHGVDLDASAAVDAPAADARAEPDSGPPPLCSGACEISQLVAGLGHTCALFDDGRVACWGTLDVMEVLGLDPLPLPTVIAGLPRMRSLIRGYTHVCGFSMDEELWCWGDASGPLLGASAAPRDDWLASLGRVIDVQTGGAHTCAVLPDGSVQCWGFRNEGELGDGTMEPHAEPAPVVGLDDVVQLAAGGAFNCARTASGRLACWGDNGYGQIGDGTGGESTWEADRLAPVFVLDDVDHVTAGTLSVCAHQASGGVLCWGSNMGGSAGIGETGGRFVVAPQLTALPDGLAVLDVQVATEGAHACALARSGRVLCWGPNSVGQIGFGGTVRQAWLPVEAGGIDDATGIAVGFEHTCAIRDRREVWCWGGNEYAQLGDGTRDDRSLPVRVVGLD